MLNIERGRLPTIPLPRIGVSQGPQTYAVIKRGEMAIEAILRGLLDRLAVAGGGWHGL